MAFSGTWKFSSNANEEMMRYMGIIYIISRWFLTFFSSRLIGFAIESFRWYLCRKISNWHRPYKVFHSDLRVSLLC